MSLQQKSQSRKCIASGLWRKRPAGSHQAVWCRGRAHTLDFFLFVSRFGLLAVSSYSVVERCNVPEEYLQNLPTPSAGSRKDAEREWCSSGLGCRGAWIVAVSCRWPPGSRGSSGQCPTGALP